MNESLLELVLYRNLVRKFISFLLSHRLKIVLKYNLGVTVNYPQNLIINVLSNACSANNI